MNDDRFEQDLRAVLARTSVDDVPSGFRAQLVGTSYRSTRASWLGWHGLRVAGLAAGSVAVALVVTVGLRQFETGAGAAHSADPRTVPVAWPLASAPPGFESTARDQCGPMVAVPYFSSLPLVVDEHRSGAGRSYWAAMFSNETWTAVCNVETVPAGSSPGRTGSEAGPRWTSQDANIVGRAGLSVSVSSSATEAAGWNTVMGTVPTGTAIVRAVIDGCVSVAVVGDGLYAVAWQGTSVPSELVAYDANGLEVDRIDGTALSGAFEAGRSPSPSACSSTQ